MGVVLGTLSALGVGGGSLLMLWLTVVLSTDPEKARIMNLMFFIPCALGATVLRWRQGKLQLSGILAAIAAGCAGSVAGSYIRQGLDLELLRKVFGSMFLLCGIRELLYRPKKAK